MISSVSNINFRGQDIDISAAGRYSKPQQPAMQEAAQDKFESKKSKKAPIIAGSIAALALATAATLGILSHKGKLAKVENAEKFMDKAKNKLADVGEWIAEKSKKCWESITGLFKKDKKAKGTETPEPPQVSDNELEALAAEIEDVAK